MQPNNHKLYVKLQPIFFLAIAFATGIVIARNLKFFVELSYIFAIISIVVAFCCYRLGQGRLALAVILMGFCAVGALCYQVSQQHYQRVETVLLRIKDQTDQLEVYGEIDAAPIEAPGRVYLSFRTHYLRSANGGVSLQSQTRLTVWLNNATDQVRYQQLNLKSGDWLRVVVTPQQKQRYRNPGSSNGEWIYAKGFAWTATIKAPSAIEVLSSTQTNPFTGALERLRNYLNTRIDNSLPASRAGVIKAAILGNGYFLNREITEDFQTAGIFHVLVISGSHVALLAGLINGILALFCKNRLWRISLTIIVLWCYGFLVGADVPVMRAILMTTVVLVAMLLQRYSQPVNILGLAGLILLADRPFALFDPGFQLTFLAVAMILLIALPLAEHLKAVGSWRLRAGTPYPPQCDRFLRRFAELLYWSEAQFQKERQDAPIRYQLDKSNAAKYLERYYLQKPLRAIVIWLMTSMVVQAGLMPLSACYFNRITVIGIPLTIVADLLMLCMLISFLIFILLDLCWPGLGQGMASLVGGLTQLFISLTGLFEPGQQSGWLKILSFRVAHFDNWLFIIYIIYYLPIIYFIIKLNCWHPLARPGAQKQRYWRAPAVVCYLLLLLLVVKPQLIHGLSQINSKTQLEVTFLDVGQGDAALIIFPGGTTMLIDSGGSSWHSKDQSMDQSWRAARGFSTVGEVDAKYLWSRGIEHLDYIVATHAHLDHIEGFSTLIKNFSIGQAIIPAIPVDDSEFDQFAAQLAAARVPLQIWTQHQRFTIDGVTIEVIWSGQSEPARLDNNQSLVLRLSFGQPSIMLTGDIELPVERQLVATGLLLTSEILKVPHHGSKTSSSPEFLNQVQPRFAVVSAPIRSRFHHPNREVMARYRDLKAEIYQTGYHGAITFLIDREDKDLRVECFAGCQQILPDTRKQQQ